MHHAGDRSEEDVVRQEAQRGVVEKHSSGDGREENVACASEATAGRGGRESWGHPANLGHKELRHDEEMFRVDGQARGLLQISRLQEMRGGRQDAAAHHHAARLGRSDQQERYMTYVSSDPQ